jgi:hypothetical protein
MCSDDDHDRRTAQWLRTGLGQGQEDRITDMSMSMSDR